MPGDAAHLRAAKTARHQVKGVRAEYRVHVGKHQDVSLGHRRAQVLGRALAYAAAGFDQPDIRVPAPNCNAISPDRSLDPSEATSISNFSPG